MTTNLPDNDGKNPLEQGTDVPASREVHAKQGDVPGVVRQEVTEALRETVTPGRPIEGQEGGNRELPIWKRMPEIMDALRRSGVLILTSETGSGKSTQVPQALLTEGFADKGKTIIVVQNRVAVAVEVAKRVADELGVEVGTLVGYLTGREKNAGRKSKILFVTAGVFKNMLRRDPTMEQASVVLFDEFDERDLLMDLGAALMEKSQTKGGTSKFCLMSATLNAQKFSEHFGGAPIVEAKGRPYPVETHFARERIDQSRMPEKAAAIALSIHQSSPEGDILIFMPGKQEINETTKALEKARIADATILPLHSELKPEERHRVFEKVRGRKIIISTNIAERGVTIDGVKYVIDSGLARMTQYDAASDTTKLAIAQCAQDALVQRRGRAGRTQPGESHCLYTERDFQERERSTKPEIQRTSLREVVMQIKAMGYSREGDPVRLIDSPEKQSWKAAKNQLRLLGALDTTDETKLSEFGEQLSELPCDPREGTIILKGCQMGCGKEAALIAAIRTGRRLFYRPQAEGEKADAAHARFRTSGQSDLLNLMQVYREAAANGFSNAWCRTNYVSWLALREVSQNYNRILGQLRSMGLPLNEEDAAPELVCRAIATGFPDKLFEKDGYGGWYRNMATGDRAKIGRESKTSGRYVLANELIAIQTQRGDLPLITVGTSVDLNTLIEDMPQLAKKERRYPQWSSSLQGIAEEESTSFNGSEIKREQVKANVHEGTIRAFCSALQAGYIQSPAAQEITGHNCEVIKRAEDLWVRSGGTAKRVTGADEIALYQRVLIPHQVISRETFDALVPATVQTDELKLQLDAVIPPEERGRIEQENPEQITLSGAPVLVRYQHDGSRFYATITLSPGQVATLKPEELTGVIPSGRELRIMCSEPNYTDLRSTDVTALQKSIEERRLSLAWKEFEQAHPRQEIVIDFSQELPALPPSETYDPQTGALAHPAYTYDSWYGRCYLQWFQTEAKAQETMKEIVRRREQKQAETHYARASKLLSASERDLYEINGTDAHREIADAIAAVRQSLNALDRQTADVPLRAAEDLQGIASRIQTAREDKQRRETEAQQTVVEHIEPEQPEESGLSGLFGQLLDEARRGGVARTTLSAKSETTHHPKDKPKKEKHERIEEQQPVPAEPTVRSLDDMTPDDMMQEYDENDTAIRRIVEANPDIDTVFAELAQAEQEMEDVRGRIDNAKRVRDGADDKRKREKAKEFLAEQEGRRDEQRPRITELRTRTQQLRKEREELERLRTRQGAIESRI